MACLPWIMNKISRSSMDSSDMRSSIHDEVEDQNGLGQSPIRHFSYDNIMKMTTNFSEQIGQGAFGKVYKGKLDSGKIVAVKVPRNFSMQGREAFVTEVHVLSFLHHPNIVRLIGCCYRQSILVYECVANGSLDNHLFIPPDEQKAALNWNTRIKIAIGISRGLEYLHNKADPAIIYGDLKPGNILLDEEFNPILSDFGSAKIGHVDEKTHVSTRVMGTLGYSDPAGKLTFKSDIYAFGIVLLELISGRKVNDISRPPGKEPNIVKWALPYLKDNAKFHKLIDPELKDRFPAHTLSQVVVIVNRCLEKKVESRPDIHDIIEAVQVLAIKTEQTITAEYS